MGVGKLYPKEERKRIIFLYENFPEELESDGVKATLVDGESMLAFVQNTKYKNQFSLSCQSIL